MKTIFKQSSLVKMERKQDKANESSLLITAEVDDQSERHFHYIS